MVKNIRFKYYQHPVWLSCCHDLEWLFFFLSIPIQGKSIYNVLEVFATTSIYSTLLLQAIANFGSGASSVAQAEFRATQYYWWFMLLTAFSGQLLAQMVIQAVNEGRQLTAEFRSVLRSIDITIPSTISASWLNWIIFRFTITLPLNYLLQINTFVYYMLGWKCCSRLSRG